jgi:2,3-bisphosphoglycerate-dependent phosphoglycerate mutase
MAKLYCVLHCESCYNKLGIFTGRADVKLTQKGCEHAQEMALKMKDLHIEKAYTSSLIRTHETLKFIAKYHPNMMINIDDRIIERDYGDLTHLVKAKYKKEHPVEYPIFHRSYDVPPPGGESIQQVEERVLPFLFEIISYIKKNNKNILIVSHANAFRPMRRFLENLSKEEVMKLEHQRDILFEYEF